MKQLIEILEDVNPGVDYNTCTDLVDGGYLNSLSILAIVAELEEAFDIVISTVEVTPKNFNSAQSLWEMVLRLKEE
ncbi:MAG: acyl carrier protein [Clostridia bacterium]|nr:acyl carrier protein [Lachnospiraceae bacterium]MBQ6426242.1 acyl carrier protein [Clostridia bacterium]MBR0445622.1 acyl carrier protein [Clostridia bacterium]